MIHTVGNGQKFGNEQFRVQETTMLRFGGILQPKPTCGARTSLQNCLPFSPLQATSALWLPVQVNQPTKQGVPFSAAASSPDVSGLNIILEDLDNGSPIYGNRSLGKSSRANLLPSLPIQLRQPFWGLVPK